MPPRSDFTFTRADPKDWWVSRDSRRGVNLSAEFKKAEAKIMRSQTQRVRRELRSPIGGMPIRTGKLRRNFSADVDVSTGAFGEANVSFVVRNRVRYTPWVSTLPRALDRYVRRQLFPRLTRIMQTGTDEHMADV